VLADDAQRVEGSEPVRRSREIWGDLGEM